MNDRYLIVAMRRGPFGTMISCDACDVAWNRIDEWHVFDRKTGRTLSRCETDRDARNVAAGLWAVSELQARADEAELCREAISMALDVPCDNLKVAVLAILKDREELAGKVLSLGRALDMELGNLCGREFLGVRDLLTAQEVLDEVRDIEAVVVDERVVEIERVA